jgi:hypothetical protein
MSDSDQGKSLERARAARLDAERARRLARQISDEHSRASLLLYADHKDAEAAALERPPVVDPPPVIERHTQQQQMQQAQQGPSPVPDEAGDSPDKPADSS